MKSVFMKFLSALLALMMISAAFTVIFTSALPSFADEAEESASGEGEEGEEGEEETEENVGFKATDLETTKYASEADKLLTMSKQTPVLDAAGEPVLDANGNPVVTYSPWISKGDYELYVQDKTGEVAIKNVKTGQVLFTNPYDVRTNVTSSSTFKPMFSQLSIKYQTIKDGKSATMNSYEEAAARDQIVVSYIKNGVCVEYTIGRADERRLVPFWMEKYRFEKLLLTVIPETEFAFTKMNVYYMSLDMNIPRPQNDIDYLEERYGCLKKYNASSASSTYTSEDYDPALESEYAERRARGEYAVPYTGRMSIRVLAEDQTTNYEKNKIEEYIRSYAPTYTYETLAYDHELTGYVGKRNTLPVFKIALEYRVDADGFTVRLPANSITFDETNFRLLSVDVLPYMGAGSSDYTGYTFVPDGSGTLIRFEDVKDSSVINFNTGSMYGPDFAYHTLPVEYTGQSEVMRYPVFGVVEDRTKYYELKETEAEYKEVCVHRFVKKTVAPDCTTGTDGYEFEYCVVCGERGAVGKIKKWEHTFTGNAKTIVVGNCQAKEVTEQNCSVCRAKYDELRAALLKQGKTVEEIDAEYGYLKTVRTVSETFGPHKYEDFFEADTVNHVCYEISRCTNPLLDENGEPLLNKNGEPLLCGDVQNKAAVDHTYENESTVVRQNGRCYETNVCAECGYRLEEEIDHVYGAPVYSEENGLCVITETCACGHKTVIKQPHNMDEDSVEIVSDSARHVCYYEFKCLDCGKTVRMEADHDMENGVCKRCGFTVPTVSGHNLTVGYIHVGSTCYRTLLCSDEGCSYEHTASRAAVPHLFSDSRYVPATCTERGYRVYTCAHCGYEAGRTDVEDEEAAALGHSYEWTTDKKVSCLESYVSEHKCTRCGNVDETKTVPAEGHIYDETVIIAESEKGDGVYKHVCAFCGHEYYEIRKYEAPAENGETPDATAFAQPAASVPGAEGDEEGDDPADPDDPDDPDGGNSEEEPSEPVIDENAKEFTVTHGYVAVVTAGSSLASLTSVHGGTLHKYNYVYLSVNPRPQDSYNLRDSISTGADASWTVVSERKYNGSYRIKYYMLQSVEDGLEGKVEQITSAASYGNSKYKAGYEGMAAAYRDYLVEQGVLTALEKRSDGIPLYLEAFGAITINTTFMTVPVTEKRALNTFDDLKKIVEELKNAKDIDGNGYSITNVNLKLTGFTNGGMNYTMPYKVKFEKVVGGDKGFTAFADYAKENNIGLYPDFDFAYMKRNKLFDGYTDSKHAVKTIDSRYIVKKTYNSTLQIFTNTGLLAVSSSVYDHFYTTFQKNYSKFNNMGISASTLGTDLNSDFDKKEPYNREDSREFTERILEKMKNDYGSVMVDGGNAYVLPYVKHILNMSLSGSKYLRTSESVPFMSMVLHGSVNYAGKVTNMASSLDQEILQIIENGASPYFIIATENTSYLKENFTLSQYYSLDYSTWKNDMIDTYIKLNDALKDVQYAHFTEHEFIVAERVPDADEVANDRITAQNAIAAAIKEYLAAVKKAENAEALLKRKSELEPGAFRDEIISIIRSYGFVDAEHSTMESTDIKLSGEDRSRVNTLADKIAECLEMANNAKLIDNVPKTAAALAEAEKVFENTMARYEIMFNVPAESRLDPTAYNRNTYTGAIYQNEQGEYIVATDGKTDADGNRINSLYTVNDKSVVRVGYDNGVEFYLNYNYFNVIVNVDGKNVVIPAYDFYKNA